MPPPSARGEKAANAGALRCWGFADVAKPQKPKTALAPVLPKSRLIQDWGEHPAPTEGPTKGLVLPPGDRDKFFGSKTGKEIEDQIWQLSTLVSGLLRDMSIVKNAMWHVEEGQRQLDDRMERMAYEIEPLDGRVSTLSGNLQQFTDLIEGRFTAIEEALQIKVEPALLSPVAPPAAPPVAPPGAPSGPRRPGSGKDSESPPKQDAPSKDRLGSKDTDNQVVDIERIDSDMSFMTGTTDKMAASGEVPGSLSVSASQEDQAAASAAATNATEKAIGEIASDVTEDLVLTHDDQTLTLTFEEGTPQSGGTGKCHFMPKEGGVLKEGVFSLQKSTLELQFKKGKQKLFTGIHIDLAHKTFKRFYDVG